MTHTSLYAGNPPRYAVTDVLLAVEVLCDGTRRVDQVLRFSEYAEAGIPRYWLVDVDEPTTTLLSYVLIGDAYELSGEYSGHAALEVAGNPFTIDLAALTPRRSWRVRPA